MSVIVCQTDLRYKVNKRAMTTLAKKVLAAESASGRSLNILYCRDNDIMRLNARFKKSRKTTDVLAFDLRDSEEPDFLGEIYVNLQQARRQAKKHGIQYLEEVKRLTVHGVLHLLGYRDHDPCSCERMWLRQEGYFPNGKK